ncbi:unnamed protein product [Brassica oleracea var. botrytis]
MLLRRTSDSVKPRGTTQGPWRHNQFGLVFISSYLGVSVRELQEPEFVQKFQALFGYDNLVTVDPLGRSGGLTLFYNNEHQVRVLYSSNRMIDVEAVALGKMKEFSEWLLKVEEGRPESGQEDEDDAYHDQMIIVDNSLVQETKDESLKQVLDAAFGDVNKIKASQSSYTDKAILTPRNDTVDEINAYTISKTDGSQETTTVMIALRFRKLNLIKMILYTRLSISIPWNPSIYFIQQRLSQINKKKTPSPSISSSTAAKHRQPVIIYTNTPKTIHTNPKDFMALVQKLTGLSHFEEDSGRSATTTKVIN